MSNDKIIGGILPFRDGFDYYNSAKLILSGNLITEINESAAWRPLYPGFLSSLLLLTGENLQWAIAIQVFLASLCYFHSAYYLRTMLGPIAAALYMTLIYFYIQPLIGTVYTEILGLALGSLGFVFLWKAAKTGKAFDLVLGLAILVIAISERAGAFFILPSLILWAGWAFRRDKYFSFQYSLVALLAVATTYLIVNTLYNKLIVEAGVSPFGNFAFTIYGQVYGGAGYHKAFEVLGVRKPVLILRAAGLFFLAHPFSFFIGAAKAYRDFFLPQIGALGFGTAWGNITVWLSATSLLIYGLYQSARKIIVAESSLLVAGFIGIFLSIPFLPPIDGGVRIYASTMPFYYALPAVALTGILSHKQSNEKYTQWIKPMIGLSILLVILTVFVPVGILYLTPTPSFTTTNCSDDLIPFAVIESPGSYIDLMPNAEDSCNSLPEICLGDFLKNRSNDPSDVVVFEELTSKVNGTSVRIFPANDLITGAPYLFVRDSIKLNTPNNSIITGCATETVIKGRPSIYSIQTISSSDLIP